MFMFSVRIPVTQGREVEFEHAFVGRPKLFQMTPGFIRNELLRPANAGDYLLLVYWESREAHTAWSKTEGYRTLTAQSGPKELYSGPNVLGLHEVISLQERIREMAA